MLSLGTYSHGTLYRYEDFASQHIPARHVDVWLPPSYDQLEKRYPVVYLHDGQNLFEPALANTGIDWGIDEAIDRLMKRGAAPGAIAVGMWCTAQRLPEY